MTVIRRHLAAPAMVVACAALIVALGGVSYAAGVLPKNSVGTAQLQKNAVTAAKVKNSSLMAADFKAGQLPAGPQGPKGETGPHGPKGDPGAQGYARVVVNASGATVDGLRSSGVSQSNVTRPGPGRTCFKGLALTPKAAVATVDLDGPGISLASVLLTSATLTDMCGVGAQAAVVTWAPNGASLVDAPYYVIFE